MSRNNKEDLANIQQTLWDYLGQSGYLKAGDAPHVFAYFDFDDTTIFFRRERAIVRAAQHGLKGVFLLSFTFATPKILIVQPAP